MSWANQLKYYKSEYFVDNQMENTKTVNPECNCHIEDYDDQLSKLLSLAEEIEVLSRKD